MHTSTAARHATSPSRGGARRGTSGAVSALRILAMTELVLCAATETLPLAVELGQNDRFALPGILLVVLSQIGAAVALVRSRNQVRDAWLLAAILTAGIGLMAQHAHGFDLLMTYMIPGYWLFPIAVLAMCSTRRRAYLLFTVAWTAVLALQGIWLRPTLDWVGLSDILWIIQPVAQVLLFGDVLVATAQARERSQERSRQARLLNERQDIAVQARREAARMLHDHVLHALHAVARSGTPGARDLAVEECRTAYRAMTQGYEGSESVRVEDLVAEDAMLTRAKARLVGSSDPLPRAIAEGLAAVVHEALSNTVRHARASTTQVLVAQEGGAVTVRVLDDGVGFDPSQGRSSRLGMRSSILQRMDDLGGRAQTFSRPSHGTMVELRWPRPEMEGDPGEWARAPEATLRRLLTRCAMPSLVIGVAMTLLAAPHTTHPRIGMLVGLIGSVVGAAGCWSLARRPLNLIGSATLLATAVVAWLTNLWLVPEVPFHDYRLWLAWSASALVQLVVVASRPHIGLAVTGAWAAVQAAGLASRYSLLSVWELSSLITAGAGACLVTLVVLVVARRAAAQEIQAAQLATRARAATARLQLANHMQQYWSQRVTTEALPLLSDVAEGRLDPGEPAVQARALAMESVLRDELVLGPENAAVIRELTRARSAGWQLTSTLGPEDPADSLDAARRLLASLGEARRAGQPITLSASTGRAAAVVFDADEQQWQNWQEELEPGGANVVVDEDFVMLSLPAHAAHSAMVQV